MKMTYMNKSKGEAWLEFFEGVGEFLLLILMIAVCLPILLLYIGCLGFGGRQ